jgi:hypothetical protein
VGKIAGRSRRAASRPCPLVRPCARPAHRQPHRQAELPQHGSQGAIGRMCYSTAGRHDQARPEHPQSSAIRALCQRSERAVSGRYESTKSCCLRAAPILDRRRHSSAVEQVFRKSLALCAVLQAWRADTNGHTYQLFVSRGARPGSTLRPTSVRADPDYPKCCTNCQPSAPGLLPEHSKAKSQPKIARCPYFNGSGSSWGKLPPVGSNITQPWPGK